MKRILHLFLLVPVSLMFCAVGSGIALAFGVRRGVFSLKGLETVLPTLNPAGITDRAGP